MGVSLSKGGNVSLTKAAPNLISIGVGLGWDVRSTAGHDFDLDASALGVGREPQGARRRLLRLLQQSEVPGRVDRAPG